MDARAKWSEVRALDKGSLTLGPNTADRYLGDPKRIAFMLSRYKFAAKMLRGCETIGDIGCGDGFGTLALLDAKPKGIWGYDFDAELIQYANTTLLPAAQIAQGDQFGSLVRFECADALLRPPGGIEAALGGFDALVCLDVIEHIPTEDAAKFIQNIHDALNVKGVAVIGTPSALAAQYASPHSQVGHINLYEPERFRDELRATFPYVFMFSMNDEMVHTGFDRLAHYLMAVVCK